MGYPTDSEIQIWLEKAPESHPERYLVDRAYEKGLSESLPISQKKGFCSRHRCRMVFSQYSFTWHCPKCSMEVENGK
jgi:hypothetical protein